MTAPSHARARDLAEALRSELARLAASEPRSHRLAALEARAAELLADLDAAAGKAALQLASAESRWR